MERSKVRMTFNKSFDIFGEGNRFFFTFFEAGVVNCESNVSPLPHEVLDFRYAIAVRRCLSAFRTQSAL